MPTLGRQPRAWGAAALIGAIAAGVIALLTGCSQGTAPPPPVQPMTRVSEADFQKSIPSTDLDKGEQEGEWRAARSDHHVIANAILACKNRFEEIASMSPNLFSALLLDLTPKGSHILSGLAAPATDKGTQASRSSGHDDSGFAGTAVAAEAGSEDSGSKPQAEPAAKAGAAAPSSDAIALTATEWYLLAMSDSIARARLSAVTARAGALDPAKQIWWATLLISGFATFFVTLQAKMSPPTERVGVAARAATTASDEAEDADKTSARQWLSDKLPNQFRRFLYQFVIIGAIALSITSTSLNALNISIRRAPSSRTSWR